MPRSAATAVLTVLLALPALTMLLAGCSEDPAEPDMLIDGVIVVQPLPEGLQAPWTLSGPRGFERSNYGRQEYAVIFPGTYTVSWEEFAGWIAPPDSSLDLLGPGVATFNGTYTEIPGPAPTSF